ncbi:MAG: MOSC domain-containing protein [Candidatus Poribacteria bacterium]|nr:MOSC domain-containing protein [Candidatus Poribacteria bacterium]
MMKVLSVNVSQPKEVSYRGETIRTGIFKAPVQGRVMMRRLNIDGDGQGNTAVHGGIDKAVYIYSIENYEHWKSELGRDNLTYGQFGENLTVEGMQEDTVHIGDVFRVGDGLVEVSQPRVPCAKLGMKMGTPEFIAPFLKSGRVGFYVRVLEESEVSAGDAIERVKVGPEQMTVKAIVHLLHFDKTNLEGAKKALRIPALASSWRKSFEALLVKDSTG